MPMTRPRLTTCGWLRDLTLRDGHVRGHRIYQTIWKPSIEEELECVHDPENTVDPYAVTVVRGKGTTIGHFPLKIHMYLLRACFSWIKRPLFIIALQQVNIFLVIFLKEAWRYLACWYFVVGQYVQSRRWYQVQKMDHQTNLERLTPQ